jgi:hypothetical protein
MEPTAVTLADASLPEERRALDRVGSYLFSYILGALLLGSLIYASGVWNFLGNTRLLDLLIRVGVVEYHDAQSGLIQGIPDLQYFLKSQDPIKWGLVELAAVIFLVFWLIKAVQFHAIAKFCGIRGTFTQHARAYLEGLGVNRLLPYNAGQIRMAGAFQAQGASIPRVAQAVYLSEIFIVFEIAAFAAFGLWQLGWSRWLGMLFWPLVILALSYFIVRSRRGAPHAGVFPGNRKDAAQSLRTLSQRPLEFSKIGLLSLAAFGLEDIAAYVIAMAFTSEHVILSRRELHRAPDTRDPGRDRPVRMGIRGRALRGRPRVPGVRRHRRPGQRHPLSVGHVPPDVGVHPPGGLFLRGPQAR